MATYWSYLINRSDGPSPDTPRLLQYLVEKNLKSTFFVVGSRAISRPAMLQYEYMAGNQICVHTWSHTALTTQTNEEIIAELGWTKYAMKQIVSLLGYHIPFKSEFIKQFHAQLGVTPNTMRPPYGDIDDRVRAISLAMGLTPIIWTSIVGSSPAQVFMILNPSPVPRTGQISTHSIGKSQVVLSALKLCKCVLPILTVTLQSSYQFNTWWPPPQRQQVWIHYRRIQ